MLDILFGDFATDSLLDQYRTLEDQLAQLLLRASPSSSGIRSVQRGTFPPVNVGASEKQFDIYLFAPGLDSKNVNVSVQENLLSVSGSRKVDLQQKAQYYRRERFDGEFQRVLTLPEDANPEGVTAQYNNGVLHVRIPRREAVKPRQITVN